MDEYRELGGIEVGYRRYGKLGRVQGYNPKTSPLETCPGCLKRTAGLETRILDAPSRDGAYSLPAALHFKATKPSPHNLLIQEASLEL